MSENFEAHPSETPRGYNMVFWDQLERFLPSWRDVLEELDSYRKLFQGRAEKEKLRPPNKDNA